MINFTCTKGLFRIIHGKIEFLIPKRHYVHTISLKNTNLRKYLCVLISIVIDEEDLEKKKNQFINDIINFNNKHIIQCYSETKSNISEEPYYISSMTSTGFINGQYKSRCYVNSLFQVLFFDKIFR